MTRQPSQLVSSSAPFRATEPPGQLYRRQVPAAAPQGDRRPVGVQPSPQLGRPQGSVEMPRDLRHEVELNEMQAKQPQKLVVAP